MRTCGAVVVLALLASCAATPDAPPDAQPQPGPLMAPCPVEGASCTDIYFVAHEDDDLLFMNPDIANSIEHGNHVVVVHLTAGDLTSSQAANLTDLPGVQQYWLDRERGNINAYTFMALHEAYTAYVPGSWISSHWSAVADDASVTAISVAGMQMAEYDLVRDAQVISLVYMRLSDVQLQDAWLNNPGGGGQAGHDATPLLPLPLAAGSVQTRPCVGCPLGTDIPAQVITRAQLDAVLQGLIVRFTAGSSYSSVSFQDASGLHVDGYGTARACNPHGSDRGVECGYYDYWDHVFGAMFVLSAALAVQATQSSPLALREYRDYTISREPQTLSVCAIGDPWCDSETTTKTLVMGYYGLYDDGLVDHGARGFSVTAPSFQRAVSAVRNKEYDPTTNQPPTYDECDANDPFGWESRQVELRSPQSAGALHGRLAVGSACLGYAGDALMPVGCTDAPTWDLTERGQLQLSGTDQCATVAASAATPELGPEPVALGPCTPVVPGSMMVLFENQQIRTIGAKCLSMTSAAASVVCRNPHDLDATTYAHATGAPVTDQAFTLLTPAS